MIKSLGLKGSKNARDLGCVPGIRMGQVIRSGNLSKLTSEDMNFLADYGLKKVVDLRTDKELEEKPDMKLAGVEYVHIPLLDEATAGITHEEGSDVYDRIPDIFDIYRGFITDFTAGQLRKAVKEVAECDGCVLIHCTEGKDRAGILSALLLYLAGAGSKDILRDYLYTNKVGKQQSRKYYWFVRIFRKSKRAADKVRLVYLADRRYLEAMIDEMEHKYGSVESFIRDAAGIDDELIAMVRYKLSEGA